MCTIQMEILQKHLATQNIMGCNVSQTSHIFQHEWGLINILAAGEHFLRSEVGETDSSITRATERSVLK